LDKLTGEAYIGHWTARMAKGAIEAGTEENAADLWKFIAPHVANLNPASILEQGCAYGRMMRHLRAQWPKAKLYGVDLSQAALDGLKADWKGRPPTLYCQGEPPRDIRVDMIFTCTVLQHVTDDAVLARIIEGFEEILNPGGSLVLFENVSYAEGGGGAHMRHSGPADYMDLWPRLKWEDCGSFVHQNPLHGSQVHQLMIGSKVFELSS